MSKGSKISELRTRERLEQQSIDVVKGKSGETVKPMIPAAKNTRRSKP